MRRFVGLGCVLGLTLAGLSGAQAAVDLSGPAVDRGSIINVEGGCGPYGHRDPYGRCRPNRPPPPPPGYYRRCPPGLHPTPYGCRPNY